MKRVRIQIEDEILYVEECEGRAEIWNARSGKATASPSVGVFVEGMHYASGTKHNVSLTVKVESVE